MIDPEVPGSLFERMSAIARQQLGTTDEHSGASQAPARPQNAHRSTGPLQSDERDETPAALPKRNEIMMQNIPLSSLKLSNLNVRKTERDADIESLAADIAARGLKQNLVVVLCDSPEQYEVVAGGRRYQALQLLVKSKQLAKDWQVPCLVEESDQGVETSLAENLHRVAMNPADEFDAFRTIIDAAKGSDDERVAYCAKRFGVTEKHVRGRLRLADLSPVIIEALRTNAITLGAAMAYGCMNDPDLQESVFKAQEKSTWKPHDPSSIRAAMQNKTYGTKDGTVLFVGLDVYRKAGGRTDIDLFTTDATERLIDTKLLDELVVTAFDKAKGKLAKKHGLSDIVLVGAYHQSKAPKDHEGKWLGYGDKPDEIAAKIAELVAKHGSVIGGAFVENDGKLKLASYGYVPSAPVARAAPTEVIDWDARRTAEARARGIKLEAFRLAFPRCVGTPLEGRVALPHTGGFARFQDSQDGEHVWLECNVRVSMAELEAAMADAEAGYDAAMAEIERIKAEAADKAEAAKVELVALIPNPPAVVEIDSGGERCIMFRFEDGRYLDIDLEGGEDEENAEYGCDYFEALIEEYDVTRWWATRDEYLAEVRAKPLPGTCRICGCDDEHACEGEEPCSWADETHTVCTTSDCMAKAGIAGAIVVDLDDASTSETADA